MHLDDIREHDTRMDGLRCFSRVVAVDGDASRPLELTVYVASSWRQRLRGLLGRPPLAIDEGLLIHPCGQIHTFGMRYALDLIYLDGDGIIVKSVESLVPNRMSGAWRAASVLELAEGGLARTGLRVGERLSWTV